MPLRDCARYLDEAVSSLEAQTLTDFEVVVVDDGSRDATPIMLDQWARRDRDVPKG
jgi:glycosyltransferase involved in cell wall biosynthesis